jgi:autotransporter-associated beta strand protein
VVSGISTLANTVTTSGLQTYTGAVTLGADTLLISTASGTISLVSTVNGAYALTINNSGATTFGGIVGGSAALTSITTDASGTINLNGGAITTTGAQTYNEQMTLGADTTLTSTGGASTITLASTVNGARTLTINNSGATILGGVVGGTTALTGITTDAGGTVRFNSASITTNGAQTYHDAVTLGRNVSLTTGSSAGNILFGSMVDGAFTLTTITTGGTTFTAAVGGTPLTGLTVTTATLSAGDITLVSNAALSITNSGAGSVTGIITGLGVTLTKTGAGRLTLSGANTYGGNTTVNGGILR